MAEFCLKCWNELNGTEDSESKYIMSDDVWLCEGCGEWKKVIVIERKSYYLYKFRFLIMPIKFIGIVLFVLWRLVILPYLVFKYRESLKEMLNEKRSQSKSDFR